MLATPLLLPALWLLAQEPSLPDALPPLPDDLLEDTSDNDDDGVSPRFFAQARVRGELDGARSFSRADDTHAGAALSGQIGAVANVGELQTARVVIVIGEGGRIGPPSAAPLLLPRPAVPQLLEVALVCDTRLAGQAATLIVGRAPVVVADGRLVGRESYDARGRTLDGASVRAGNHAFRAGAGAYWLGPYTADASDDGEALSALLVIEAAAHVGGRDDDDGLALASYLLLHRDGRARLTTPTIGARIEGTALSFLRGRAGADAQAFAIDGDDPFAPAGTAFHLECGARATAPLSTALSPRVPDVFLATVLEATTGDVVGGRSFRAPAPSQHGALGLLDLVAMDNTWSAAVSAGALDSRGLLIDLALRMIGLVQSTGPLLDTAGESLAVRVGGGIALLEIDARLQVPLGDALSLDMGYAVGLPGRALIGDQPAQRLYVSLTGSAGEATTP